MMSRSPLFLGPPVKIDPLPIRRLPYFPRESTQTITKCCTDNTIAVSGTATVQAVPDIGVLNAQMTAQADTVK